MHVIGGEVSVTHEIVIDGEKSWIKYGVSYSVEPGEGVETARERATYEVNTGIMRSIRETVETVKEATT